MCSTGSFVAFPSWCPAVNTTISSPSSGTVVIQSNDTLYTYETLTGAGRGFAPMYVGNITGDCCISANITLDIQYKPNVNVYCGFMLLTGTFVPMFECGVGGTNIGTVDPIQVSTQCTISSYVKSAPGSFVQLNVSHGGLVNFNDGTKTTTCTLSQNPVYIALYLRGSGKNTATYTNVSCTGISNSVTIPTTSPRNWGIQIPGADYQGTSIINIGQVASLDQCKILCDNDMIASGFSYDSSTQTCKLIQDMQLNQFGGTRQQTSSVFLKNVPMISEIFVAVNNQQISNINVNEANISVICVDNASGNYDAVAISDSTVYVSQFGIVPIILSTNQNIAVLSLKFTINGQAVYLCSQNNYDFKRVFLVDSTYTPVSGATFINQHMKFNKTSAGVWDLAQASSYVNIQQLTTFPQISLIYGNKRFQFNSNGITGAGTILDDKSFIKLSVSNGTRFICLNQNILILITVPDDATWNFGSQHSVVQGSLFFNSSGYTIIPTLNIGTSPVPSATNTFSSDTSCSGTVQEIDILYGTVYRNFTNRDTFIFNRNGTLVYNGTQSGSFNSSTFSLKNVAGYGCLAQLQLIQRLSNITNMYANSTNESKTDFDWYNFPVMVSYNTPNVTIEFLPVQQTINYIQ
jgi:hypothetical protein